MFSAYPKRGLPICDGGTRPTDTTPKAGTDPPKIDQARSFAGISGCRPASAIAPTIYRDMALTVKAALKGAA
jgi:hypothetical protein